MRSSKGAPSESALAMAPAFHQERTCSFPGQCMEDLWWKQWQCDRPLCVVSASSPYSLLRPERYTSSSRRLLKKLRTAQVVKTSPQFTEPSSSLPCSQQRPLVSALKVLQSHSFEIRSFITLPSISRSSKCFLLPHHKPLCTYRPSTTLYNLRN